MPSVVAIELELRELALVVLGLTRLALAGGHAADAADAELELELADAEHELAGLELTGGAGVLAAGRELARDADELARKLIDSLPVAYGGRQ